jgi:hypothetical protein
MHQFNLRVRVNVMNFLKNDEVIKDNGESRVGLERRQFSYTAYIPERRSGRDRRKSLERRRAKIEYAGKNVGEIKLMAIYNDKP